MLISAGQIKAARAMLDWTRDDLADATGLSSNTIRNLEAGAISPRHATNTVIRQAIEGKGLEFTEREGVRRRPTDMLLFQGQYGCDQFFEDILQIVKTRGGDILAAGTSFDTLLQTLGDSERNSSHLEQLARHAKMKCLLSECVVPGASIPSMSIRILPRLQACPSSYFIYGDRIGFVIPEGSALSRFMVIVSVTTARHWRDRFLDLWRDAVPLPVTAVART